MSAIAQEAEFFDRWAQERMKSLRPTDPAVLDRYRNPRNLFPKEFCFQLLGDLRGKSVLELGCGEGEDAVLLAKLGARVTGLDVSAGAVELARKRAALDGVSDRTDFIAAQLSEVKLPPRSFDVIWVDNVLHHLLDDLDATLEALLRFARPGALFICNEPVNLSKLLRRVRFLVPVHTEVTPGERPLEKRDLAVLERRLPGLRRRHFNFLGRLVQLVIPGLRYERASWPQRALADLLVRVDRGLLWFPPLQFLGGIGVMHAQVTT
jgi:SAM-dependent methyltransferase